jgi:hypothetical protein
MKGVINKMKVVTAEGTYENIGFELGYKMADEIHHNLSLMNKDIFNKGIENKEVDLYKQFYVDISSTSSRKMMEGISRGSGISYDSILRYNAFREVLYPEGCTTFAAIGKATSNGKPVLLKNRDKPGNLDYCGTNYYKNREVNVVNVLKTDKGNTIVGVTAAGSMGIMMGLNKYGVAVASNAGGLTEISNMTSKELYGISGRPQMLREGLECKSAQEAVDLVLQKLTKSPMGSPGMLFFLDAKDIYVIEGSWLSNQFAVQHITDGAISRSNHFELLEQLNNQKYISAICRKIRAQELVEHNLGRINSEVLKEFSMDHENGPFDNSICRHSKKPEGPVTVSAAIMEIDSENPQKSKISIALGSPCCAWSNKEGNFTFQMDSDIETIPQQFLEGSVYKDFFKPEMCL